MTVGPFVGRLAEQARLRESLTDGVEPHWPVMGLTGRPSDRSVP
jgi:hypothetical protein